MIAVIISRQHGWRQQLTADPSHLESAVYQ
jgi:hypothetical protein